MEYQTLSNLYLQQLNDYLLPDLDYEKLHSSCNGEEKEYAGETLKRMHDFFVDIYGTDKLGNDHAFVCVPGVVKSRQNGQTALALLDISIQDGGEHFGTQILSQTGVRDLHEPKSATGTIKGAPVIPYDYWYTVSIKGDHHVNNHAPDDVQALLAHCQPTEPCMEMQ